MSLIVILIVVPLLAGLVLFGVKCSTARRALVVLGVAAAAFGSIAVASQRFTGDWAGFHVEVKLVNEIMMAIEIAMGAFVIWVGVKHRRPLIVAFMLAQSALLLWLEFTHGEKLVAANNLLCDKLSIIMALIIGVVGGVIGLYALGYMREFHEDHHPELTDRRPMMFGLIFVFLGAMFGLVFSNNLIWLYFFWEITTLCSFFLIGYKQNEESTQNALRALVMNLSGGLAFAAAIVWFFLRKEKIELDVLIAAEPAASLVPVALLCFAGITKSAQFPFVKWLLGAMVAPTPVSALLHSSTMVKAGVYLIIRLAPVLNGTVEGIIVAMVGAVTFLIGSFAAIGTSDAKKVLAYSTVANLGLIVMCGGIGTYEAVWAGVLLIIFHAVAKCLLFLCVGVIEHKLHSRNIEAMSGLILSMPRLSIMLQIGIAGMFLAPFGMLISKWAVLKAVVDAYPLLTVFVAFGSAATLFFWVKWLGKLIEVVGPIKNVEKNIGAGEWFALYSLSFLTAMTCLAFPLISFYWVEPYVTEVYGRTATMSHGNFVIMIIMMAMVCMFPLSFLNYGRKVKVMDAYLGGANVGGSTRFQGAGEVRDVSMTNYYFGDIMNEARLFRAGVFIGVSLLVFLLGLVFWPFS